MSILLMLSLQNPWPHHTGSWKWKILLGLHMCWTFENPLSRVVNLLTEIGWWMSDCFLQQWNSNLWDDSGRGNRGRNKLRTYRKFKQEFYYLVPNKGSYCENECVLLPNELSSIPLQIEKGKYHRPRLIPTEQWYCPTCLKMGKEVASWR